MLCPPPAAPRTPASALTFKPKAPPYSPSGSLPVENMDTSFADLIQEITRECKNRCIEASSDFVAFLVSLVSLSSTYRADDGEDETSNETKILASVIEKLLDQSGPSLATLKLQFHFAKHYRDRESIIKKHRTKLASKTSPLVKEICEVNKLENAREIERLYQKMLVVITLLSGLGNPTIPTILREVAIALQSVLQPSELPRYVTLSKREKEEQLTELVFIVAGIRLFNRDCQRGGEGIDDLPSILQAGMNRTRLSIIQLLELLMEKVYKFTAGVEAAIQSHFYNDCEDGPEFKDILWSIEMLVATRQQEIYVRKLLSDLEICEEEIRSLINRLQNRLIQLHETVKYRTAIPTTQVYPQFIEIAEIWLKLQDEVIVLSYINDMLWQLQSLFPKSLSPHHQSVLERMLQEVEVLTDAERLEQTMGKLIVECGECSLAYPSNDTNFDKINLQFLGFCAWSFVVGKGALIPGNPNIGVAEWAGKCFAFSSVDAARQFGKCPDRFLYAALDIVRERQEYIHLFQLYNDIQIMNRQERLSGEYMPLKIRQDQEVQTEMHVFPTFVDKNYASSLWLHRQRALHLASICQCVTKSTQTSKSHFRTGICLQTSMPKEKEVQTRKDGSTNTKKMKKYIFGLRGRDNNVELIDCAYNK
ncbi:cilia- and flagella-associated protein 206-like isoform X1 [Nasonia vitripennis]|uniref:Cilia- and flagella-associated protein 206 n=2 Tax=Nasonia vitripennis TaxID=7425 RepID=A0A7M7H384_NASVI|nr:cilia- and flagella-associated protein 206-like isoform X1 [Nasonia vitripennis]